MSEQTKEDTCGALVAEITWPEVESRANNGAMALLPIGSGAKEHGHHLPMGADLLQCQWLTQQLIMDLDLLVWPGLSYGFYPAFTEYPGSCSIDEPVFVETVGSVLKTILRIPVKHIGLLNSGISTIEPLNRVLAEFDLPGQLHLINIHSGPHYKKAVEEVQQSNSDGHAGELESSIMLAITPDLVHLDRAQAWPMDPMVPGPLRRYQRSDPGYSPTGVCGDPTLADADKGRQLLDCMLQDIRAMLRATDCNHIGKTG